MASEERTHLGTDLKSSLDSGSFVYVNADDPANDCWIRELSRAGLFILGYRMCRTASQFRGEHGLNTKKDILSGENGLCFRAIAAAITVVNKAIPDLKAAGVPMGVVLAVVGEQLLSNVIMSGLNPKALSQKRLRDTLSDLVIGVATDPVLRKLPATIEQNTPD